MSERRSPLKIPPEKRKYARVAGMEDEAGSSPRKKSSSSNSASGPGSQPSGSSSPEPNCPICLGRIDAKAFAHGCFHSFCRTCLFEWSKVKPECPVCRQQFSRIIFNVKSMSDYEEHVIPIRVPNPMADRTQSFHFWALHNLGPSSSSASASLQRLMTMDDVYRVPSLTPFIHPIQHIQTSASSSAATGSIRSPSLSYRITISPRQQMWSDGVLGNPAPGHLRLTATHRGTHLSVTPSTQNDYQPFPPVPGTSAFRRYIYDYNLWAKGDSNRPTRISSARFYRENPALTHRLIAFINRELNAILDSCQAVLPQIITSLTQCDFRSRKFRRIIEPHLVRRTDQFIHEVYSFAISTCHDMLDYDNRVVYVRKEQTRIFTTEPPVPPLGFSYELESSSSSEDEDEKKSNSSSVIEILDSDDDDMPAERRDTDIVTEVVTEATVPIADSELHINIIDDFDNPRPGPSGVSARNLSVGRPARNWSDSESDLDVGKEAQLKSAVLDDSDSGDSVQIIGSKKPLRERTPVLVDLSDSDSESTPRPRSRKKHRKWRHRSAKVEEVVGKQPAICSSTIVAEEPPSQSGTAPALRSVVGNIIINGQSSNAVKEDDEVVPSTPKLKSVIIDGRTSIEKESDSFPLNSDANDE